ncbi:endonuclease/exonuclease/phosphatase family protein [Flavihumibacter sp. CACIAM 22H1]|uniref:endonuclease/exonuclease/phosphatase family protein n=1 Tax=Flavihumibacter sp. CACIAM 22H1 TaxID=1812911 RepID=UPI0007A91FF6|nr:endonuclease/exonuclease/phosphatase family protein [Flavihumibacter sp. CACIAM 22H1]KYP14419.1 MAG: hypothetical protein A1D16_01865 [Flavihumibacter sp. CACIAM 22H1]
MNLLFRLFLGSCLLAGCRSAEKTAGASASRLVVLSYNIHHANPPSRPAGFIDLDTIAATIRASGADLVAIQELDSVTTRSNGVYQLAVLAEKLGMYYRFERTIPFGGGAYGIGILSRFPIQDARAYALPNLDALPAEPRKALLVQLNWQGTPLYFGCTHFDFTNQELKLAQAKALLTHLAAVQQYPVLVAGDFNAEPEEASIRLLSSTFGSAGKATDYTIPELHPDKKIDYIFYTPGWFQPESSEVLTKDSYGSDHLPLRAVFKRLPTKAGQAPDR